MDLSVALTGDQEILGEAEVDEPASQAWLASCAHAVPVTPLSE
jgi:hypothetical protein